MILNDLISCKVTEERNGEYSINVVVSADDSRVNDLVPYNIVLAKPNDNDSDQPFVIYKVTKPLNGRVTVLGEHISRRLKYIPIDILSASGTATQVLTAFQNAAEITCPFTFSTDITSSITFNSEEPSSMFSWLFGREGSFVDKTHGEWKFDTFSASLMAERGADNGVSIEYGKNLTGFEYEVDISNIYTGIYPYWIGQDDEGNDALVTLSEKIIYASNHGSFDYERVRLLDLSQSIEKYPTEAQLRRAANSYLNSNDISTPEAKIKVSFVPLWQASGYERLVQFESVALCDTVHVSFDKYNVSTEAKVVKTVYDVLKERYESVEIGTVKQKLTRNIQQQMNAASASARKALSKATNTSNKITLAAGGSHSFTCASDGVYQIMTSGTSSNMKGLYIVRDNSAGVTELMSASSVSVTAGSGSNNTITITNTHASGTLALFMTKIF